MLKVFGLKEFVFLNKFYSELKSIELNAPS